MNTESTGLALSGGGFRATLFHIGSLWRLNELGLLSQVGAISGCSGGAIVAAWLGLNWRRLEFDGQGVATNFEGIIAGPLRALCCGNHDVWPSVANMAMMLFGLHSASLVHAYRRHLYGNATLADLPTEGEGPDCYLCTSNLVTGSAVHFRRGRVHDARLGEVDLPDLPLALVVAASCAFPPFLSPCIIHTDPAQWNDLPSTDLHSDKRLLRRMCLTDGGIHDPLGLEPLRHRRTLLISDATVTREVWRQSSSFWIRQLGRTTIMQTVANARQVARGMVERLAREDNDQLVVHWCNAEPIDAFGVADALARTNAVTRSMGTMRTRLNHFTPREQGLLINWGYALCDAAVRSGMDAGFTSGKLPVPEYGGELSS